MFGFLSKILKLAGWISDIQTVSQLTTSLIAWIGGSSVMGIWAWFQHLNFVEALAVALSPGLAVSLIIAVYNHHRTKTTQPKKSRAKPKKPTVSRARAKATPKSKSTTKIKPTDEANNRLRRTLEYAIAIVVLVAFIVFGALPPVLAWNLDNRLQQEYPLGYVIFDIDGNRLGPMRFHPTEAILQADWREASITLDKVNRVAALKLPNPSWHGPAGGQTLDTRQLSLVMQVHYVLNKAVEIRPLISVKGQPAMFLEVLNDTGSIAQCVVGLK